MLFEFSPVFVAENVLLVNKEKLTCVVAMKFIVVAVFVEGVVLVVGDRNWQTYLVR